MLGHKLLLSIIELVDETDVVDGAATGTTRPSESPEQVNIVAAGSATGEEDMDDLRRQYEEQFLLEMQAKRYEQLKYYFQNAPGGKNGQHAKPDSQSPIEIQDIR